MRQGTRKILWAVAVSLPMVAWADDAATKLVTSVIQGNAKITQEFQGIGNLKGFVLQSTQSSDQTVVYADDQGRYMVAGALINPAGQNLAQSDLQKYVNDPMAPAILKEVSTLHSFYQGQTKAPHQAYILAEPNCSACHALYQTIAPAIQSGSLGVHWVMLAFRQAQSAGQVAAMWQSPDPASVFANNEANFNESSETGGAAPLPDQQISAETKKDLAANLKFLEKYNFVGTPVIIYQNTQGQPEVIRGYLPGKAMLDAVNQMGGAAS